MDNYSKIKAFFINLFFPKFCLGCKKEGSYLCEDCRSLLDICEHTYFVDNKYLAGLLFALPYKERHLTKKLIHQFKYEPRIKGLAKTLAGILAEHLIKTGNNTNQFWENSVLIPVPLDKTKLKNRGYNQSEELAKELSKIIKVPVVANVLIKIKKTAPQMELSKTEREKNLEGAFSVKPIEARPPRARGGRASTQLADKKIFLVDDVYTTGSTMAECSRTLKNNGAKEIWGICIAREN